MSGHTPKHTTEPDTDDELRRLAEFVADCSSPTAHPQSVLMCESPSAALARAASSVAPLDCAQVLDRWCHSARLLLKQVQRDPGQFLLLDADEVHVAPQLARTQWRLRNGLATEAVLDEGGAVESSNDGRTPPRINPLALAAAHETAIAHSAATDLWLELHGSCTPLQELSDLPTSPSPTSALLAWQQHLRHRAALGIELNNLGNRCKDAQQRVDQQEQELSSARADAELASMLHRQALEELAARAAEAERSQLEAERFGEELRELAAQLNAEQSRLREARGALQSELEARHTLQETLAKCEADLEEARVQSRQAAEAIESACLARARENVELAEQRNRLEAELAACRQVLGQASTQKDQLRQALEAAGHRHRVESASLRSQLHVKSAAAGHQAEEFRLRLLEAQVRLESLEPELHALRSRVEELDQQLVMARAHATQWQHRSEELEDQLLDSVSRLQNSRSEHDALRVRMEGFDQQVVVAREHARRWQHEVEALEQQVESQREAASLASRDAAREADALREALEEARALASRLIQDDQAHRLSAAQHAERTEREARCLLADLDESRTQISRLEQVIVDCKSSIRELRQVTEAEGVQRELLEDQLHDALAALAKPPVKKATPSHRAASVLWRNLLMRGRFTLASERTEQPHRELALAVDLPADLGVRATQFELRLVEHQGRPGLIWLADAPEAPPLFAWHSTGREGVREFMRLIPLDAADARVLVHLPSADWRLVQGMALALIDVLPSMAARVSPLWTSVARRLLLQLQADPPRLRYSKIHAHWVESPVGAVGPVHAEISLEDVIFGDEDFDDIRLRFVQGAGTEATLTWLLPSSGTPPVASWPVADDGRPKAAWSLAFGHAPAVPDKHRWWMERPSRDQALLLGILDALPGAAAPLEASAQGVKFGRQAVALHREAHRLRLRQALVHRLGWLRHLLRMGRRHVARGHTG